MMEEENFAYWYRRAVHAFGAIFLAYYLIPDAGWIYAFKVSFVVITITVFATIEMMRIKKIIKLFGTREYESNRFGSYLYFGIGTAILLLFFPQQIAVPCILSAAYGDPAVGEMRRRFSKGIAYMLLFVFAYLLFYIVWHSATFPISILVPVFGATGAVIGEMGNFKWVDDDFLIQIVPAIIIGVLWLIALSKGVPFLPYKIIHSFGG